MSRRGQRGVTLLELLVALFIFAVAVGALLKVVGGQARITGQLEVRYFAELAAHNHLAELHLQSVRPAVGRRDYKQNMAGLTLKVVEEVAETDDPRLRRVVTRVYLEEQDLTGEPAPLAELQAFMGEAP